MRTKIITLSKAAQNQPETREKHRAAVKAAWAKSGVRERHRAAAKATWAKPEVREKRRAALKVAQNRPEVREKRSDSAKAAWAEPGAHERRRAAAKVSQSRSEVRAKLRAAAKAAWTSERRATFRAKLRTIWAAHKGNGSDGSRSTEVSTHEKHGGSRGPDPLAFTDRIEFKVGKLLQEELIPRFQRICADVSALPRRSRVNPNKLVKLLPAYSPRELDAARRSPSNPKTAARWFVSLDTKRSYNVVAKYHQIYARWVAKRDRS